MDRVQPCAEAIEDETLDDGLTVHELRIDVPEKGSVSGLMLVPRGARSLIVFAHGAGAGMRHPNLESIAHSLARRGIATMRYQFPYMEARSPRTDRPQVAIATVIAALEAARELAPGLRTFIGGHSFGGRMTTLAAASTDLPVDGLILCSFPLHAPKKPDSRRAEPLGRIDKPMLFLSGDRDVMADSWRMTSVVAGLAPLARLHWLETADHGYRVLKRTRSSSESVFDEIARVAARFISGVTDDVELGG